jgi:hypothetical protein
MAHFNVNKGVGLRDYGNGDYKMNVAFNQNLFRFLNTVPKDAVIAAHPFLADGIPTFAQRIVFVNAELAHPFFDKYWETIKGRTVELLEAYYAEDSSTVQKFCRRNGISYFVVDRWHYDSRYFAAPRVQFEPFNTYVRSLVDGKKEYALLKVPNEEKIFIDGEVFVIECNKRDITRKASEQATWVAAR